MSFDKRLSALQDAIGYQFKDRELLVRAMTHRSFGDGQRKIEHYERLEFLGDRVLGILTAELLYDQTNDRVGGLARKLNALVRKESCADVAKALDLGEIVQMSKSTEKLGGREKPSILGDLTESLLAALYLDGGFEPAKAFYLTYWAPKLEDVLNGHGRDAKSELQERSANKDFAPPVYTVMDRSGPDHRPHFIVEVSVEHMGKATGEGGSKKEAERKAALKLLSDWASA